MTATVTGTRVPAQSKKSSGRRRFVAFGLAGVVVAAGVAGAVVTSSAYFTDEKTVTTNTVSTNSISIALNNERTTSALTTFAITNLAPYTTADLAAYKPVMKVFNVKNSGTGDFNWTGDIDTFVLTKTDGSALPGTTGGGSPSSTDAQANIYVQFGTPTAFDGNGVPTAVTWETARTLADSQTSTNKEIAQTSLTAGTTVNKVVRFYMDSAVSNNYQNVKLSYTLRVNAEQPH
ncbi:hypothetical protein ACFSBZ_09635 [Amnibacterium flavum]|uniref:Camelysin metallo-endopeptidase n=1 Tax=Amnibacterium flavum TaxID=2173173 RepID=A0A2V1HX13_9MICO|nr:hypothetical protein [Amnibacterium flavum]PVZ95117.1 hypothetical protein DDQ50_00870 [Amnibacterium flavum]